MDIGYSCQSLKVVSILNRLNIIYEKKIELILKRWLYHFDNLLCSNRGRRFATLGGVYKLTHSHWNRRLTLLIASLLVSFIVTNSHEIFTLAYCQA